MNIQKFTQKSMQAVEGCERLAYEYGNQEIEQEHLLYSLLKIDDSLNQGAGRSGLCGTGFEQGSYQC